MSAPHLNSFWTGTGADVAAAATAEDATTPAFCILIDFDSLRDGNACRWVPSFWVHLVAILGFATDGKSNAARAELARDCPRTRPERCILPFQSCFSDTCWVIAATDSIRSSPSLIEHHLFPPKLWGERGEGRGREEEGGRKGRGRGGGGEEEKKRKGNRTEKWCLAKR
jgi:hypothetical protein